VGAHWKKQDVSSSPEAAGDLRACLSARNFRTRFADRSTPGYFGVGGGAAVN